MRSGQRRVQALWVRSSRMCEQARVCWLQLCYAATLLAALLTRFLVGLLNSALLVVRPAVAAD